MPPDASQMPSRCLPDASQMPPRCRPDVSRCFQMLPRCLPDAFQMPPGCLPVPPFSRMCHRCPPLRSTMKMNNLIFFRPEKMTPESRPQGAKMESQNHAISVKSRKQMDPGIDPDTSVENYENLCPQILQNHVFA